MCQLGERGELVNGPLREQKLRRRRFFVTFRLNDPVRCPLRKITTAQGGELAKTRARLFANDSISTQGLRGRLTTAALYHAARPR